jgi:hypothetical protein
VARNVARRLAVLQVDAAVLDVQHGLDGGRQGPGLDGGVKPAALFDRELKISS